MIEVIIMMGVIGNFIVQSTRFYLWLKDRDIIKEDNMQLSSIIGYLNGLLKLTARTNAILAESSNQQLEVIDKLEFIRINSNNTARNTYKKG